MRSLTISEILELDAGEIIPSITGKITAIYDRKTGEGDHGPWSVQSGNLSQNGQPPIRFSAWNFDDLKSLKGKEITISSFKFDKHGLIGVIAVDNEYPKGSGKITRELKITGSASIEENNLSSDDANVQPGRGSVGRPGGAEAGVSRPQSGSGRMKGTSAAAQNALPAQNDSDRAFGGLAEARRHLMRSCNLYVLCAQAVDKAIFPQLAGELKTNEIFQAAVSTLFIEASREVRWSGEIVRPSLIDSMPTGPMKLQPPKHPVAISNYSPDIETPQEHQGQDDEIPW